MTDQPTTPTAAGTIRDQAIAAAMKVFRGRLQAAPPYQYVVEEAFDAAGAVYAAADEAETDRILHETGLAGLYPVSDGVRVELRYAHDLAAGMVKAFDTLLQAHGAENYVEQESTVTDPDNSRKYTFIVVKPGGLTPHQLRRAAEQERDEALAQVDQLGNTLNGLLDKLEHISSKTRHLPTEPDVLEEIVLDIGRTADQALASAIPFSIEHGQAQPDQPEHGLPMDAEETADALIKLGELTLAFGRVERKTFHPDGQRPETDTDHTVMLALAGCALATSFFPQLDPAEVAEMALVHDLPEAYAGDTPTLRLPTAEEAAAKAGREAAAVARIRDEFDCTLPWLPLVIEHYEAQRSPEARFVRALDKLMPKVTHILNGAIAAIQQGMSRADVAARYREQFTELSAYAADFPHLLDVYTVLVERELAILAGHEADPR